MYHIDGKDYLELFNRGFTETFTENEASANLYSKFACYTSSIKDRDFSILHFRGNFQQDVTIDGLENSSHLCLHFQLRGHSDAKISGFKQRVPFSNSECNLLNCIDPLSTFTFPKQQGYEYLCIVLNRDFFYKILSGCQTDFIQLSDESCLEKAHQLFPNNQPINPWLLNCLQLLIHPPVSSSLRLPYLRSKVQELTALTLSYQTKNTNNFALKSNDEEKLRAVRDYLALNFLDEFSLSGIAQKFYLNEFKLKKGFKELFGYTVFEFIFQLRMKHAYLLSISGGLSIGEIGSIIGYGSDASFIRAFKKQFGCAPGKLFK